LLLLGLWSLWATRLRCPQIHRLLGRRADSSDLREDIVDASFRIEAGKRIARAQAYPTRSVRWLVGFVPGGAADTVVRIMGRWLSDRLNKPFIIENRPGAATSVSIQAAVSSPPDASLDRSPPSPRDACSSLIRD
jgi:hypothetical protein